MIPRSLTIAVVVLLMAVAVLGFYVFHLKKGAAQQQAHMADTRPIAPPIAGPATQVVAYLASDDDGALHKRELTVVAPADPAKRVREILRALIVQYEEQSSPHPLGPGSDINDVFLVGDNLAVVDVNAAFADGHRSGILIEELTLASMAQTLAANQPGITRLKLLVDGKERATLAGHAGLSRPYDVAAAARLVAAADRSQETGSR